jgi:surface polysaccharide O-acyltransferase-like enzyme
LERLSRNLSGGTGLRIVALLLLVALASVVTLWTANPTGSSSQSIFGIYLAVDLVSFAMISYIYRATKSGDGVNRAPIVAGCLLILILVSAGFAV